MPVTPQDYFTLLGLDPDAPWNQEAFEQALADKKAFWDKRRTGMGPVAEEARYYWRRLEEIKRVMNNPAEREKHAKEARKATSDRKKAELERLGTFLEATRGGPPLQAEDIEEVLKKFQGVLSRAEIEALLREKGVVALTVAPFDPGRPPPKRFDPTKAKMISEKLARIGETSLYSLLQHEVDAKLTEKSSAAQLHKAAEGLIQSKLADMDKGDKNELQKEMAGEAREIFKSEATKRTYDFWLTVENKLAVLVDAYRLVGERPKGFTAAQVETFLRKAYEQYQVRPEDALVVLQWLTQDKQWKLDLPSDVSVWMITDQRRCERCRTLNARNDRQGPVRTCRACGAELVLECPNCGASEVAVSALACPNCGFQVGKRQLVSEKLQEILPLLSSGKLAEARSKLEQVALLWAPRKADALVRQMHELRARIKELEEQKIKEAARQIVEEARQLLALGRLNDVKEKLTQAAQLWAPGKEDDLVRQINNLRAEVQAEEDKKQAAEISKLVEEARQLVTQSKLDAAETKLAEAARRWSGKNDALTRDIEHLREQIRTQRLQREAEVLLAEAQALATRFELPAAKQKVDEAARLWKPGQEDELLRQIRKLQAELEKKIEEDKKGELERRVRTLLDDAEQALGARDLDTGSKKLAEAESLWKPGQPDDLTHRMSELRQRLQDLQEAEAGRVRAEAQARQEKNQVEALLKEAEECIKARRLDDAEAKLDGAASIPLTLSPITAVLPQQIAARRKEIDQIRQLLTHIQKKRFFSARDILRILSPAVQATLAKERETIDKATAEAQQKLTQARNPTTPEGSRSDLCLEALERCEDYQEARQYLATLPIQPPTNLQVTKGEQSVQLTWTASSHKGIRYAVVRKPKERPAFFGDGKELQRGIAELTYKDTQPVIGLPVYYAVFAEREGTFSKQGAQTQDAILITQDVSAVSSQVKEGEVRLTWKVPEHATGILAIRTQGTPPTSRGDPQARAIPCDFSGLVDRTVESGKQYFYAIYCQFEGQGGKPEFSQGYRLDVTPETPPQVPRLDITSTDPFNNWGFQRFQIRWSQPPVGSMAVLKWESAKPPRLKAGDVIPKDQLGREYGKKLEGNQPIEDLWMAPGACYYIPALLVPPNYYIGEPQYQEGVKDVSNLKAQPQGDALRLTWTWPRMGEEVLIAYSTSTWPQHLAADPTARRVKKQPGETTGTYTLQGVPGHYYYLVVAGVVKFEGQELLSPGVRLRRYLGPTLTYEFRQGSGGLFGKSQWMLYLHNQTDEVVRVPALLVISKRGMPPKDKQDGTPVKIIEACQIEQGRSLQFPIGKDFDANTFGSLFQKDEPPQEGITIQPVSPEKLRLS